LPGHAYPSYKQRGLGRVFALNSWNVTAEKENGFMKNCDGDPNATLASFSLFSVVTSAFVVGVYSQPQSGAKAAIVVPRVLHKTCDPGPGAAFRQPPVPDLFVSIL